jgi:single-strand DNA-binding protein
MNSLNSILIEGNLTKDPALTETPKGTPVCKMTVASNRFYRQDEELQKEVSFFEVEVWSRLAEACAANLTKGRGVRVVGRLKQDRWTDTEGKIHERVKIVAEHVEFKPDFKKADREDADSEEVVAEETLSEEDAAETVAENA